MQRERDGEAVNTVVRVKTPCNHPMHAIITLFTCGMWAPFWIAAAVMGRTETVQQYPAPWLPHQAHVQQLSAPPNVHHVVPQREWNPYKGEWQ